MLDEVKLPELKATMYHIVKGLAQKAHIFNERDNKKIKYPDSPVLRHGLNELVVFAMVYHCYDENGMLLAPIDETDAVLNYFSKPVIEWMGRWPRELIDMAHIQDLLFWDSLIEIGHNNTFILSEFCEQLSDVQRMHFVETEFAQEDFYRKLIKLEQKEYEAIRRFVIEKEHRVMRRDDLNRAIRDFGIDFGKMEEIKQIFDAAYETWESNSNRIYICPHCGWTVQFDSKLTGRCHSDRCRYETNSFSEIIEKNEPADSFYRLKKGIVRYVSVPGDIELDIEKQCKEIGLQTEMWPEMDRYDLRITFSSGEKWCIDAKDYSKAFLLKYKIENDKNAIPYGDWDRGFIIIPDQRLKSDKNYCKAVNRGINIVGQDDKVQCVGYKDFISIIRSKAVEVKYGK